MESPTRVPASTTSAEMPRWASPASSAARSDPTRPTSSTSPVNMALLPARRVERAGDVLPDLLHLSDPAPQGLGHSGRAQRPDQGHPLGPDELGCVEQRELVRESSLHKTGGGLPAPLDQHAAHAPPPHLVQDALAFHPAPARRRPRPLS